MTRRELINFRHQIDVMCDGTGRVSLTKSSVIALLDDLETARNTQRWIPVTERLPEKDTSVICYTALGQKIGWIGNSGNFNFTYGKGTVTHWMPLSEPPKGDTK